MSAPTKRILRAGWALAGLGFLGWMIVGFQSTDVPQGTLQSDAAVTVAEFEHGVAFQSDGRGRAGLLFLPGGMVDPLAYAPLLRRVAAAGYDAQLLYLPMRCGCGNSQTEAVFDAVERAVTMTPEKPWVLAGHSRGAMLAARYLHERNRLPRGAALIGTTHPRDFSLAGLAIPVTKIYGTRDGIAGAAAVRANADLLPPHTAWVAIEGGNHVQFGYYGHQLGDDAAEISREAQQDAVLRVLLEALAAASPPAAF